MKKMATIGLLATSILILTACSTTKNKENSAAAKEDTVTSQSSETKSEPKEEKVNLNGKDAVEYYNLSYKKPKNLDSIVGIYKGEEDETDSAEHSLIIFSDGRYILADAGGTDAKTTYFDKNNIIQKKEFTATSYPYELSVSDAGRIIEKDGVDYLVSLRNDTFLNNLDCEGHQIINQFFSTTNKDEINERLNDTETNQGFIKDGKYYESKDTLTSESWNKVESDSKTKTALENVTFKSYENNSEKDSQYVKDLLGSNTVNDLFYLVGTGRETSITDIDEKEGNAPEIKVLSSDELKSVKETKNKLKYGFKITEKNDGKLDEFPNNAYATDGSTVYALSYDQLGITAQELGSAASPSYFLE